MRHGSTWTYQRYHCHCEPCRAANTASMKRYVAGAGRPIFIAKAREYAMKYPERKRAWHVVEQAVRKGQLTRPDRCGCGRDARVIAHHDDYAKPLDVRWLCSACHTARHEELKQPSQ